MIPATQLLAFGFSAGAKFEGQFVGALERLESGGALRILDALFVAADEATGELVAINLEGNTGGLTAKLLDFRLDPAARLRTAEGSLESDLGKSLEPGSALVLVLIEHVWARAMEDAVARVGGTNLASEFVEAAKLSELAPDLPRISITVTERPTQ
ncbi:MAG TPA: hypothetical protein VE449_00510 [Thermoleophilaceae bacterium]|jgi:hypothetical protein|nr:hypothetical protein [Thermoleophilaceae bacterium]